MWVYFAISCHLENLLAFSLVTDISQIWILAPANCSLLPAPAVSEGFLSSSQHKSLFNNPALTPAVTVLCKKTSSLEQLMSLKLTCLLALLLPRLVSVLCFLRFCIPVPSPRYSFLSICMFWFRFSIRHALFVTGKAFAGWVASFRGVSWETEMRFIFFFFLLSISKLAPLVKASWWRIW